MASQRKEREELDEVTLKLRVTSAKNDPYAYAYAQSTHVELGDANLSVSLRLPGTYEVTVGGVYEVTLRKVEQGG